MTAFRPAAPEPHRPAVSRRRALTGLGFTSASAALLGGAAAPASGAAADGPLPVLPVDTADWTAALRATPQVQLVPGATYVLPQRAELPSGCYIAGNGATVTVTGTAHGALSVNGQRDVTLTDIRLRGQTADPIDTGIVTGHVGLRLTRSTNVRVLDCDFTHWRGAGITVTGSVQDDYYAYRVKISGCAFHRCYFGVSTADRSEYSQLTANSFAYCRLAIWNSSGNWTVNDNTVVGCYGAYYSFSKSSPYGTANGPGGDNWGHGALTGNTFNHSNNGGSGGLWDGGAAFPLGGTVTDPGRGVVVDGVLPPTFSGNTLWYTNLRATNLLGTRWLLSGSTFSNLNITCSGATWVHLAGTQSRSAAEAPKLSGNVKDLLPG
ncbi:right-handed parallel beta-helix repeat-containing protein [Streptomyces sp. NA04227]|uniref:right-handed parallel beta-helix repeat-containing protein n=1 Tax=Streptomyces sp. NA04227 TaxID=2742136 RepID=UPI00159219D9|nr:right-handed parallel beta-helix repeat-containing protein [Streptomyces sp. NA04227]QKW06592.1 right-handed parallel beta-helix repeat-containing protein [Streptomyces sp. NA04227]